jgi:hypothetical protein
MRSFTPSDFQTQVSMEGTRGHIVVDALDKDGKFVNRLNFKAKVAAPEADGSKPAPEIPLRQTAPGHYEAWFDAAKLGTYLVNVTRERADKAVESTITGLVVPYSPEYRDLAANEFLMTQVAQIGGGASAVNPAQVFGANRPAVFAPVELYTGLLALALLLFPFDVAVRRLAVQREDFARALAWLRAKIRGSRPARGVPATPEMARLMNVKGRALAATAVAGEDDGPVRASSLTMDDTGRSQEAGGRRQEAGGSHQATALVPDSPSHPLTPSPPHRAAQRVATLRPDAPAPTAEAAKTESDAELSGMSRLMAAKQRAKDRQKPRDEEK